ncbi:MAG: DUF2461 family protein [Microthrixaceae bacterium]
MSDDPGRDTQGDDPTEFFWDLASEFLVREGIEQGQLMGFPCLRAGGEFFATCDHRTGVLIVKLDRDTVAEMVESGHGALRPRRPGVQGVGGSVRARRVPLAGFDERRGVLRLRRCGAMSRRHSTGSLLRGWHSSAVRGRDKAWFSERRRTYESAVATPAKAFVDALGEELRATVSPGIESVPKVNGSISPSTTMCGSRQCGSVQGPPPVPFLGGSAKKVAPTLFVRLSRDQTGFATGVVPESLVRWRDAVASGRGAELTEAIDTMSQIREVDVVGQSLKRVPAGYDAGHPREGLLRHKFLQVRWVEETPPEVHSGAFVPWCAERLGLCEPVHHWLVAHATGSPTGSG